MGGSVISASKLFSASVCSTSMQSACRLSLIHICDGFLERQIKAMSVTAPTDGGYLVPEVYASEIIPLLRDKAIILRLGATRCV